MNREPHIAFAVTSTPLALTALAPHVGAAWSGEQITAAAALAAITCMAPDLDNLRASKKVDRAVPDEVLGGGGPLGHRQLTHFWGIPVGLALLASRVDLGVVDFLVYGALWGYLSHILLDLPFGEQGMGTKRGVPLLLWYGRIGGWFYSDRLAARVLIWPICGLVLWAGIGFPYGEHLPDPIPAWLAAMPP